MRIPLASALLPILVTGCSGTTGALMDGDGGPPVELADSGSASESALPDSCGASGDVNERIASCAASRCVGNDLSAVDCARPHAFDWDLVARGNITEVWRDRATGIVWGSDHVTQPSDQAEAVRGCAQPGRYEAGLASAFRLPAIEDFELATSHGIYTIVHDFGDLTWWSSSSAPDGQVWAYTDGKRLAMNPKSRDEYFRYRCVTGP